MSKIEWTDETWVCVTGCSKVSAGCANCYAERMTRRLEGRGDKKYVNGFNQVTMHEYMLSAPYKWKKSRMIFVNSMSDTFHQSVSVDFIKRIFQTMENCSWHQFQILTKRSGRLLRLDPYLTWKPNMWMGVTVEKQECVFRIDQLRETNAAIKFLSLEPLLEPLPDLDLDGIHWVIAGGESGPGARPVSKEWIVDIRDQCLAKGVAFFFKQWGGKNKRIAGRILEGRTWDEFPVQSER